MFKCPLCSAVEPDDSYYKHMAERHCDFDFQWYAAQEVRSRATTNENGSDKNSKKEEVKNDEQ